jgi:hypothetical protein
METRGLDPYPVSGFATLCLSVNYYLTQLIRFLTEHFSSVKDPYGIHLIWIRIQHFRLHTGPDPDPRRIQGLDDKK